MQQERATAVMLAGSKPATRAVIKDAFDKQVLLTDKTLQQYRVRKAGIGDVAVEARDAVRNVDGLLEDLTGIREKIRGTGEIAQSDVAFRYRVMIAGLAELRQTGARLTGDTHLQGDLQTVDALSELKEQLNQERIVIHRVLSGQEAGAQGVTPQLRRDFEIALAGQEQAFARFLQSSEKAQRDLLDQTLTGSDLRKAILFEGEIRGLAATGGTQLQFSPNDWDQAISAKADLLREVEKDLDEHIVGDATIARDNLQRTVLVETALLLGMLLLAILFAWLVARSMARSLRELRHGALTVAQYGLPQAVSRLRDANLAIQASPDQVARQIAEPLPVRSRDEFGQVTEAFNAVHLEAVRTAAEQAQLRASVATMFVNLARRSQILVDRLIGHLDRLERGEEDPDRLGELFQLDHLATRMRRNDENLLVLAGADSSRIQREPAPLMDVLRAAQSEVEHYTRIEFGVLDRDVEIAAHAVNDMVHLIAELLDNATAFSPPDSAVVVEARRLGDRAVLLVEDRGIGISHDQLRELNDKLANPPVVDVAVSRMMGLVVVARLAARHGVKVELRPARERGTVADITLPASVLVQRTVAGRPTGVPSAGPGTDRQITPPEPRTPLGASPLALESGAGMSGPPPVLEPAEFGMPGAAPFSPAPFGSGPMSPAPFSPPSFSKAPAPAASGGFEPASANGAATAGPPPFDANQPPPFSPNPPPPYAAGQPPFNRPAAAIGGSPPAGGGGGGGGRGLPPWSDLTGARGANGARGTNGGYPPARRPEPGGQPLPQRRAGDHWTVEGEVADGEPGTLIPRQRPVGPQALAGSPVPGAPVPGPVPGGAPMPGAGVPPGAAPPPAMAPPPPPPVPVDAAPPPPAWPVPAGVRPSGDGPAEGFDDVPAAEPAMAEAADAPEPAGEGSPDEAAEYGPVLDMTAEIPRVRDDWESADALAAAAAPEASTNGVGAPGNGAGQGRPDETMELPIFRELESMWFRTRRPSPVSAAALTEANGALAALNSGAGIGLSTDTSTDASTSTREHARVDTSEAPVVPRPAAPGPVAPGPVAPPMAPGPAEPLPSRAARPTGRPTPGAVPGQPGAGRPGMPWSDVPPPATPPPAAPQPAAMPRPGGDEPAPPSVDREREPVSASTASDESVTWRTAADEGWRAAEAIAREQDFAVTDTGLPKRVPMSQLVPGGVETGTTSAHRRTPEAVRGLLSAYHRGVQRGRSQNPPSSESRTPEPTQAGPRNPQGGKEHEA
jgi:signal transduction histidine kinase